jgi:Mg2+ and Co2+ transporter CorA
MKKKATVKQTELKSKEETLNTYHFVARTGKATFQQDQHSSPAAAQISLRQP